MDGTAARTAPHPDAEALGRPRVSRPTIAERAARGRAAREVAPRSRHGTWEAASDRADPVGLLEEQARTRIPELVPIRHGRMLVSPFAYFRGAALPMAADLGVDAGLRPGRAALRRRAPVELRGLRVARAPPVLRRQRLRRDRPRAVGVGRQAPGREPRGGGPRERVRGAASAAGSCGAPSRSYRETMRDFAGRPMLDGLVRAPGHGRAAAPLPLAAGPEGDARASGTP